jgi:hypothetical protein
MRLDKQFVEQRVSGGVLALQSLAKPPKMLKPGVGKGEV